MKILALEIEVEDVKPEQCQPQLKAEDQRALAALPLMKAGSKPSMWFRWLPFRNSQGFLGKTKTSFLDEGFLT
jgi:hypothetical protein